MKRLSSGFFGQSEVIKIQKVAPGSIRQTKLVIETVLENCLDEYIPMFYCLKL